MDSFPVRCAAILASKPSSVNFSCSSVNGALDGWATTSPAESGANCVVGVGFDLNRDEMTCLSVLSSLGRSLRAAVKPVGSILGLFAGLSASASGAGSVGPVDLCCLSWSRRLSLHGPPRNTVLGAEGGVAETEKLASSSPPSKTGMLALFYLVSKIVECGFGERPNFSLSGDNISEITRQCSVLHA
jgi:hypothetical protein